MKRQRWETPDGEILDVDLCPHPGSDLVAVCRRECMHKRGEEIDGPSPMPPNNCVGPLPLEYVRVHKDAMPGDATCASTPTSTTFPDYTSHNRPIVVLIHGMESHSRGPTNVRVASAFYHKGFDIVALNFRACAVPVALDGMYELTEEPGDGDGPETPSTRGTPTAAPVPAATPLRPRSYHAGFTFDVNWMSRRLFFAFPDRRMYIAGFSLGGNTTTKFLGELGHFAADRNIVGGAVLCAALDPHLCQKCLDGDLPVRVPDSEGKTWQPLPSDEEKQAARWNLNRSLYAKHFIKSSRKKLEKAHQNHPDAFNLDLVLSARSCGEIDTAFTVPVWGAGSLLQFYTQTAGRNYLPGIRVPLFGINAMDDPCVPRAVVPSETWLKVHTSPNRNTPREALPVTFVEEPEKEEEAGKDVPEECGYVRWQAVEFGGHGGFVGDHARCDWEGRGVGMPRDAVAVSAGWGPWSLARFIASVEAEVSGDLVGMEPVRQRLHSRTESHSEEKGGGVGESEGAVTLEEGKGEEEGEGEGFLPGRLSKFLSSPELPPLPRGQVELIASPHDALAGLCAPGAGEGESEATPAVSTAGPEGWEVVGEGSPLGGSLALTLEGEGGARGGKRASTLGPDFTNVALSAATAAAAAAAMDNSC
uniref:AB hydrolase-1 domain-containing protein n=1 Tax=Chromera velia CCMP2878 TaxID=1169474 RepID=A0A0G4HQC4_9ALVE|eukprot:Cvel_30145.t1-p1 / transcript=Cvel_30145.t1 / gene=Cvel_30145 / organism=Chromera_velia_CCMP2878 / gene_product=hypothetical protein / transcript_product=hypothetical protein / location=Cvel_scaffold4255:2696-5458(+) / protein_length=644 / sequence_SO=supercontig / SO=protein_coding / is_pseudo=false